MKNNTYYTFPTQIKLKIKWEFLSTTEGKWKKEGSTKVREGFLNCMSHEAKSLLHLPTLIGSRIINNYYGRSKSFLNAFFPSIQISKKHDFIPNVLMGPGRAKICKYDEWNWGKCFFYLKFKSLADLWRSE